MAILVFDFGGTSIKYGVCYQDELLDLSHFFTPDNWEECKKKILEVKQNFDNSYDLLGVAFSMPGCVDQESGRILGYSGIRYIHDRLIEKELTELLELPISIENDANCAALAEASLGIAKDASRVLFAVVGTGIGGAIVKDGKIDTGAHLYGGEFGFMYLCEDRKLGFQSLSELASPVAMARRYCEKLGIPQDSHSGKDIFKFATEGDKFAKKEVDNFYKYLGVGLYNLQVSFDPDIIVIGGAISVDTQIIVNLENKVNEMLEGVNILDFKAKLIPCFYKNDANLVGAVRYFHIKYEK